MDDLKSIVEYHEQARRKIENQLSRLAKARQKNEQLLAQEFSFGVSAFRR